MPNTNEAPKREERTDAPRRRTTHRKRKVCIFCEDANNVIDYKNAALLRKFISERGKILPRRITGTCARHQRALTTEIKRARHVAILPFTED